MENVIKLQYESKEIYFDIDEFCSHLKLACKSFIDEIKNYCSIEDNELLKKIQKFSS